MDAPNTPEQPARIPRWWIAVPVAFTVAALLVVDMFGSAAIREFRERRAVRAVLEAEVQQEPYHGTPWGRRYWEAIERYQETWEPYYIYRVGSMRTEFINVSNGVRATYRMPASGNEQGRVVFLFGGSAAWGHGARDEGTIPSWLAKMAEEHGERLDVRNYAESGWVNWQGISYLLQKLADGEHPDTVIFYSGANEVLGGRKWPQVRRPIWDAEAVPRAMTDWALERRHPLARVWDYYRNTSYLWSRLLPRQPALPPAPTLSPQELAARVAEAYIVDKALVERLGHTYGFKALFVWQLSVADKRTLTAQERRYAGWLQQTPDTTPLIEWWAMDSDLKYLYEEVGRIVKARGVLDIAPALDHVTTSAFIDWMHTSEAGNEQIGRALYEIVRTAARTR